MALAGRVENEIILLLVDDHTLVREGLRKLLNDTSGIRVLGDVGDGRAAVRLFEQLHPDVVVTDLAMPGLNGPDTIRLMLKVDPRAKILVLSVHGGEPYVREALMAGARGFVLKTAPSEDLVQAIRCVAAGQSYLSPEVSAILVDHCRGEEAWGSSQECLLSLREREVLQLLGEGKRVVEIARTLNISRRTVQNHRDQIAAKLACRTGADLVKAAIKLRLTS